jgi:hypothetical protein
MKISEIRSCYIGPEISPEQFTAFALRQIEISYNGKNIAASQKVEASD